jgi:hypothetical protein
MRTVGAGRLIGWGVSESLLPVEPVCVAKLGGIVGSSGVGLGALIGSPVLVRAMAHNHFDGHMPSQWIAAKVALGCGLV